MKPEPSSLPAATLDDERVVLRVKDGDVALFEILMRRYNQRLYRIVRSILGGEADVEDVIQDTWLRSYRHLDQFEGRSSFATWLTKIAVHEALARAKRRRRFVPLPEGAEEGGGRLLEFRSSLPGPEEDASRHELMRFVEEAVDHLPDSFREVFVMREVEQLNQAETAECLGIREETVKTRLHRARGLIEAYLLARAGQGIRTAFSFGHSRCDRIVAAVLERIAEGENPAP